ncbi:spore germination protein GerPB [Paenibacillus tarimensis]
MELVIHQQIFIQKLDVGSVTNSSVLQIGSAGQIKALSNLYNTGGFTAPAPPAVQEPFPVTLVPLPAPVP